jgi:hypothetical protein
MKQVSSKASFAKTKEDSSTTIFTLEMTEPYISSVASGTTVSQFQIRSSFDCPKPNNLMIVNGFVHAHVPESGSVVSFKATNLIRRFRPISSNVIVQTKPNLQITLESVFLDSVNLDYTLHAIFFHRSSIFVNNSPNNQCNVYRCVNSCSDRTNAQQFKSAQFQIDSKDSDSLSLEFNRKADSRYWENRMHLLVDCSNIQVVQGWGAISSKIEDDILLIGIEESARQSVHHGTYHQDDSSSFNVIIVITVVVFLVIIIIGLLFWFGLLAVAIKTVKDALQPQQQCVYQQHQDQQRQEAQPREEPLMNETTV